MNVLLKSGIRALGMAFQFTNIRGAYFMFIELVCISATIEFTVP